MATTTHTLEGPDLEALLARVPDEHGPDAVIVAANKLRRGGIGGFFAREAFEVVVDVPVPDLVSTGSREEPASAPAPSAPRISTEAVGFASVLERMVRDAGIEDEGPRPVGPALARPAQRQPAPLDELPVDTEAAPGTRDLPEEAEAEEAFEPLHPARVARDSLASGRLLGTLDPPVSASPATSTPATGLPGISTPAPTVPAVHVAPLVHAAPAPAVLAPALDQRWLARVGLPTNVAAKLTTVSTDPMIELLHLMEQVTRPEPLPTGRGAVIAVVGRRADALEVCDLFAAQLGLNPEEILVAAPTFRGTSVPEERRLPSVDTAHEQRRAWRRRPRPTIVAVDGAAGRARSGWATHLLEAVEPTMVWGVVEASRKAEDIRDWAKRLGGLDALAVTGLDDTVSPATVLGAGVPVGLLDGHEASASRWTAVLSEHLEVAA